MGKRILTLLFAIVSAISFIACGNSRQTLSTNDGIADQSKLYGMCYEANVRFETGEDFDIDKDVKLLKNMGVTSLRLWMHMTTLLTSPDQINQSECDKIRVIIGKIKAAGIMIVGMSHTNFNNGTQKSGKPKRDISEGSYYVDWLNDYYKGFKTLASTFPEIEFWEMDNEVNNTDFMKNTIGESVYSQEEMADIATDIFYYASKGIHEGNKNAKTVMGGLVGLYSGKIKTFLEKIYVNIKSGEFGYFYDNTQKTAASKNPDDYFEIACWHPYIEGAFSKKVFKTYNDAIYQVILDNEKKHKKVIFSEVGFSNTTYKEAVSAKYVTALYEVVKDEMPYVESVQYFKLFDYADPTKYWTKTISRYGLLYDPDKSREYNNNETDDIVVAGSPKPAAFAFQAVANGQGDINLNTIN